MSPKGALDLFAVDHWRPGPALRRTQDDHGPSGHRLVVSPRQREDLRNVIEALVEHACERLMRGGGVCGHVDVDLVGLIATATKEMQQILRGDASQKGRIRNFVPVEVQDGKNRSVATGVDE